MIVITTLSFTGAHGPPVVMMSVTVPAMLSFGPGVYTALKSEGSLNDPSPPLLHVIPVVAVDDPASVAVAPLQIVCGVPASTVAFAKTVMVTSSLTGPQTPVGSSVVSRNV